METKSVVTLFLLHLFLALGTQSQNITVATSSDAQRNITTFTDDYVRQNQRQYANNIVEMDAQLAAFKSSYEHTLEAITAQKEFLLAKLLEVNNKLYPLQSLNDLNKYCVQKYIGNITTSISVQLSISNCVVSAISNYASYVKTPLSTRNGLSSWYNINLLSFLNQCSKNHENPSLNYTNCVIEAISSADSNTAFFMKTFTTQLEAAKCSADARIKLAVDCSFKVIYSTISIVGETYSLIDNCAKGLEMCPPCEPVIIRPPTPTCEVTVSN